MNWPKCADFADYVDYADFAEYAECAKYAKYAEYEECAKNTDFNEQLLKEFFDVVVANACNAGNFLWNPNCYIFVSSTNLVHKGCRTQTEPPTPFK